jgi:hypothetical protein
MQKGASLVPSGLSSPRLSILRKTIEARMSAAARAMGSSLGVLGTSLKPSSGHEHGRIWSTEDAVKRRTVVGHVHDDLRTVRLSRPWKKCTRTESR